jgi:hypothetical protein
VRVVLLGGRGFQSVDDVRDIIRSDVGKAARPELEMAFDVGAIVGDGARLVALLAARKEERDGVIE